VATTDRAYYIVRWKPEYAQLIGMADDASERIIVSFSQGGFAQDVADFERQVKERFLEAEFEYQGIELDRIAEVFDLYFTLEEVDQVINLDDA
jgi:hypothetical protein